ncbi:MAG: 16S rRNA (uracil(1498)-N(3))-methyltransferase [Gammaproteobacteria bacterium]
MRVTRIYYPGHINTDETLTLPATASHHLIRVLRYRKNAVVTLFNGEGGEYSAALLDENPTATKLGIQQYIDIHRESPLKIKLIQGISRGDHMDTTIQKTTELGITEIVPVICQRSARTTRDRIDKKLGRWRQIAISACEQSGRNRLPVVHEAATFDQAISHDTSACKLVLDPAATDSIKVIAQQAGPVSVLCGPEGGLSGREIEAACKAGFRRITFGPRILRTETAGPSIVTALQLFWGDMG